MVIKRDRKIFRTDLYVRGKVVVSFLSMRMKMESFCTAIKSMVPAERQPTHVEVFEGINGPAQRRGEPVEWTEYKVVKAGEALFSSGED